MTRGIYVLKDDGGLVELSEQPGRARYCVPIRCATPDGAWRYAWDAENRLIRVEPVTPVDEISGKVEFAYDYTGRRVRK